jgi:hypothetical protein
MTALISDFAAVLLDMLAKRAFGFSLNFPRVH